MKNSSISQAVGMCPVLEACALLLVATELVFLVVEPGVIALSESFIGLQGVVSLSFLHQDSGT